MHEPLTNLRRFVFLQFARNVPQSEVWRALYGTLTLQGAVGKFVIAVNEDIDPGNPDSVFWAMSYRCQPFPKTPGSFPIAKPVMRRAARKRPSSSPRLLIDVRR